MPIYEEKELVDRQKRYYIRTYVIDEKGLKRQITRHNKQWIGRDGYREAMQEENRLIKRKVAINKYITFSQVAEEYLSYKSDKIKKSSIKTYQNAIDCLISKMCFYNKNIYKITKEDIQLYRNYFDDSNYKLEYKNKIHHLVKSIFDYCILNYNLEYNYESMFGTFYDSNEQKLKNKDDKIKYIKLEDFNIIMDKIKKDYNFDYWLIYHVLFYTGLRKGELMALRWNKYDSNKKIIIIKRNITLKTDDEKGWEETDTKTGENRIVVLDEYTNKLLSKLQVIRKLAENYNNNDFIFGIDSPISTSTLRNRWKKAFINTNIQPIVIHELRHSHVSFCINEYLKSGQTDANKFFIMMSSRMGHTIEVMQKTYMHLFPEIQNEIINLIDNYKTN